LNVKKATAKETKAIAKKEGSYRRTTLVVEEICKAAKRKIKGCYRETANPL
jgi:hypothetical protein